MEHLTQIQKKSSHIISSILYSRLNEQTLSVNKIQQDDETGSSLCEIELATKKAILWFRPNGSASSIGGQKILLKGGALPKGNVSLSCFVQNKRG